LKYIRQGFHISAGRYTCSADWREMKAHMTFLFTGWSPLVAWILSQIHLSSIISLRCFVRHPPLKIG
jgi:hypothetical protein